MIKIITTFQCALVAILMGILGLATDYWKVWFKQERATNLKIIYNSGLFFQCSEATKNTTELIINHRCSDLAREGKSYTSHKIAITSEMLYYIWFFFIVVNCILALVCEILDDVKSLSILKWNYNLAKMLTNFKNTKFFLSKLIDSKYHCNLKSSKKHSRNILIKVIVYKLLSRNYFPQANECTAIFVFVNRNPAVLCLYFSPLWNHT